MLADLTPWGKRLLRWRYWVYAIVVVVLLVFRVIPGLRSRLPGFRSGLMPVGTELRVSGMDTAPSLIPRLVAFYHRLYPQLQMETRPGGTVRAVEDLLNRRAEVAFLSRPLSAREDSVVRAVGDSLLVFPVALSGILVLAAGAPAIDSLSLGGLRKLLIGGWPVEWGAGRGPVPVYASDPALGLWGAVAGRLGLADTVGANVTWVADDREVARAVVRAPGSIGLASSLALDLAVEPGCRAIRLTAEPGAAAGSPSPERIVGGGYPLYHYLYAACRSHAGALAAGFVSFMQGEQGQALVRREGFLPAQEIAREIELGQMPVGMPR